MGLDTKNSESIDIDSAKFLRDLPISEKDKEILSIVIATIATSCTSEIVHNIMEVIYGDTKNDEQAKSTIDDVVSMYTTDSVVNDLATAIYNTIKKEDIDNE